MCVGAGDAVWGCLLGLSCRSFCSPCVLVVSTLSSGYVRAPLPYRLVNAGLFDYKKKKKKKKKQTLGPPGYFAVIQGAFGAKTPHGPCIIVVVTIFFKAVVTSFVATGISAEIIKSIRSVLKKRSSG